MKRAKTKRVNTHRAVCVQTKRDRSRQNGCDASIMHLMSKPTTIWSRPTNLCRARRGRSTPLESKVTCERCLDSLRRSSVTEPLSAILDELGVDELRVVAFIANRLRSGCQVYGPLIIATDHRDWRRERDEELADAVVYSAIESLRRDLRGVG